MSAAASDARLGEVLADEALEHARYLAGLAQRINDHDPALSNDDEAQAADSDLSSIAVWLKNRAQEWLAAPPTNAPEISTSLVDAEMDRLIDEYRTDVINGARMGDLQFWRHADESRAAIHAHVAQVKREAHDIGFRRGLRELPPDLRDAPVVYVATDADEVSHLHHKAPRWDKAGELWWSAGREPLSREIAMGLLGVAAGECAAFRLVRRAA